MATKLTVRFLSGPGYERTVSSRPFPAAQDDNAAYVKPSSTAARGAHADRQPRREALRRHDHRRERQVAGPQRQRPKVQAANHVRASGKDEGIRLTPPRKMTLEQAIAYIQDDELVGSGAVQRTIDPAECAAEEAAPRCAPAEEDGQETGQCPQALKIKFPRIIPQLTSAALASPSSCPNYLCATPQPLSY